MRMRRVGLLAGAALLVSGCRSVKEFAFPTPSRPARIDASQTTNQRHAQDEYEARENWHMRRERKGHSFPDPVRFPPDY